MDVIWDQYDIYVCHMTLPYDSHIGNSYVLHIVYLPDTDMTDANAYDLLYGSYIENLTYAPQVAKVPDTHIASS